MRAVLFDLDGTITEPSEGITKCVQYALSYFGIEVAEREKLYPFIGPPLDYSFRKFYGFSEEQALKAVEKYRERYRRVGIFECSLYPGVADCLTRLREAGCRIGLASFKPEGFCREILTHFGILELFDEVTGASLDGSIGTKEEVLRKAIDRFSDIPRQQMCLVGDTLFDVEGAALVGIPCVAVSFGFGDVEEMRQAGAVAVCDSMEELPGIIHTLQ